MSFGTIQDHFRFPVLCVRAEAATLFAAAEERGFARIFAAFEATFADVVSFFAISFVFLLSRNKTNTKRKGEEEKSNMMWFCFSTPTICSGLLAQMHPFKDFFFGF